MLPHLEETRSAEEKMELIKRLRPVMESDSAAAVTWFRPDMQKSSGIYITTTGRVKKVDRLQHRLVMEDSAQIPIDAITHIDSGVFLSAQD